MMTRFQRMCKSNPRILITHAFDTFLNYYPNLNKKDAKDEFNKQVKELFFNGSKKEELRKPTISR